MIIRTVSKTGVQLPQGNRNPKRGTWQPPY